MNTERLYREDPYTLSIQAKVLGIDKVDKYYDIVTDRTVFFPEGGGQPSDTGFLIAGTSEDAASYEVVLAHDQSLDGPVYHRIKADGELPFAVGDTVTLELDFDRRFRHMQRHSGEHILSGAFYLTLGGANKGFHMGTDYITIDIDLGGRAVTPEELRIVEKRANQAIWDDLPFSTVFYPDAAAANTAPVRKVVDLEGVISVVFVGDPEDPFDCVACCGTHVSGAGQIGLIKIYKVEMNKGMNRVYFDCGEAAYDKVCEETDILTDIANRYSTAKEKLIHKLEVEDEKSKALRETVASLSAYYRENRSLEFAARVREAAGQSRVVIPVAADALTPDDLLKFAYACIGQVTGASEQDSEVPSDVLAVVTHEASHTAVLVSSGSAFNCGQLVKEHAFACGGKGGGRPDNARAVFPGAKELHRFVSLLG